MIELVCGLDKQTFGLFDWPSGGIVLGRKTGQLSRAVHSNSTAPRRSECWEANRAVRVALGLCEKADCDRLGDRIARGWLAGVQSHGRALPRPWLAKEGRSPTFQSLSIRNLAGAGTAPAHRVTICAL